MSLTQELNNPHSPINKWFHAKYHQGVGNIVRYHNQVMSLSSIIKPIDGTDFPLVGTAVTYGLRKFVAVNQNNTSWINDTIAGKVSAKINLKELAQFCSQDSQSYEEEALKLLILSGLENYYRSKGIHQIIQPFFCNRRKLNPSKEFIKQWLPSIRDVAQITVQLPTIWQSLNIDIKGKTISNANFTLSDLVHADCQMIIDGAIIDIRTTAKKKPFSLNNLYQQLSYLLFNCNNEYDINKLAWVYTRQKVAFYYSVDKLFKDIHATRIEFKQMIQDNYRHGKAISDVENANPLIN